MLADLDIKSTLYLPKHDEVISVLFVNDDVNISMLDHFIQKYEKSKNAMYFFFLSFRQILNEKDKIYITFDRLDLTNELKNEKVILANIVAKEYYQLQGDNTNHVITLIPENRHYESIDPYKFMGYKEFSDWDKYLNNAQEYNWLKYEGFAVSF